MGKNNSSLNSYPSSQEWRLGNILTTDETRFSSARQSQTLGRRQSPHHLPVLSVATGAAVFFHAALILSGPHLHHQKEQPPVQAIEVEVLPPLSPSPSSAELPSSTALQTIQDFRTSAFARTDALEQTLIHTLGQQAALATLYAEEVDSLKKEQTELTERLTTLDDENKTLTAQLAIERERTTTLQQQLQHTQQTKESELLGIKGVYDHLIDSLQKEIAQQEIALHQAKGRLTVRILERVLFPSGQATLTAEGEKVIEKVGEVLEKLPDQRILVEGHTDNVPIGSALSARFPTNWELSAARATEVVKYLLSNTHVPAQQLGAVGRSDTTPIASNATEDGRKLNRRIEIIVFPTGEHPPTFSQTIPPELDGKGTLQ